MNTRGIGCPIRALPVLLLAPHPDLDMMGGQRVQSPAYAQNPLDTFPRNFPVDGEVANLLRTCYGETGVMDVGLYSTTHVYHPDMHTLLPQPNEF